MFLHEALTCFEPEDDVDRLFKQLPRIEPSREVIADILQHIRSLPAPSALARCTLEVRTLEESYVFSHVSSHN